MTTESRFAKALDGALGEGPPEAAVRVQRANLLAAVRRGQRPAGRVRWELVALPVAAAVGVVAILLLHPAPQALTASWRGGAEVERSTALAAGDRTEAIEFSDGSRVVLEPKASARIVKLEPKHAELALQDGKLAASVVHREGVRWNITAGPYEVRVVGTKFTVGWERSVQSLRVAVTEGRVRVSGGDLGEQGIELTPGQRLERRAAPPVVTTAPASTAEPAPEPRPLPAASLAHVAVAASAPAPSVGELARSGKYHEAVALAERHGFERVIAELAEGELLALGNAARYTGAAGRARQAMQAVRERFSGRPASQLAAFYLAKIAEQLDANPREAARWLRVFLSESPTGKLAADARASLLSVLLASGDNAGATEVARDYLRYHPSGPIADRARLVVSRSEAR
jgi:transmembrane sensor